MHIVRLEHDTDISGWRSAARQLIQQGVSPEHTSWQVGLGLFDGCSERESDRAPAAPPSFSVPRVFVELCERVLLHRDPRRFALMYRLLWRLRSERGLMQLTLDADVAWALRMGRAVRRDMHKMKAFVRFRELATDDGPLYIAWFEPEHHILAATAPFFARRFATMRWAILSPAVSVRWDGLQLLTGPGAQRGDAPAEDAQEALWLSYYHHIFNPARLKIAAMRKEMPRRYWRNLPEAQLISPLIAAAHGRTYQMLEHQGSQPRKPALLKRARAQLQASLDPAEEKPVLDMSDTGGPDAART